MEKKMIFLSLFLLMISGTVLAQESEKDKSCTLKHEVVLRFADLFNTEAYPVYPVYDLAYPPYGYYYTPVTSKLGLMYKLHLNTKNALRLGVSYGSSSNKYDDGEFSRSENLQSDLISVLGYQYTHKQNKVGFYFGADCAFLNNKSVGESENNNPEENYFYFNRSKNSYSKYGILPFLGIQYQFNESLSVSVETNYALLFSKNKYYNEYQNQEGSEEYENSSTGFETGFYQIGILAFHYTF